LLAALVGVGRAAIALVRDSAFGRADRIIRAAYNGLLDLQALYGIGLTLYLLVRFGFDPLWPRRILHPLIMLGAVVVAHGARALAGEDDPSRHRAQLIGYLVSFAIIFVGVLVVQASWLG